VLSALSATTASRNFEVTYRLSETRTQPPTTSTFECKYAYAVGPNGRSSTVGTVDPATVPPTATCSTGAPPLTTVTGQGTINVDPKAMVVSASISSGLDVSVRLDDNSIWESGGADYGTNPTSGATASSGQPLSGFASITESTIGKREGAIGMLGMASPSGYLDLESESIAGAAKAGTGDVDGVPVTYYQVAVDPSKLVDVPGMTADEITTVRAAVEVLDEEGYTGTSARVAVDAAGYIRQVVSVASFADGGTVTLDSTFSKFGCAGTVTMPGQTPAPPPPPDCTSPVPSTSTTAQPPTTTLPPTTTTPASTTVTDVATTEPPVATTVPDVSSTASTTPAAGGA
jgi:hypothetical protein